MSAWTHCVCEACWNKRHPDRLPIVARGEEGPGELARCCACAGATRSGIYVRGNPEEYLCKGKHDGAPDPGGPSEENRAQAAVAGALVLAELLARLDVLAEVLARLDVLAEVLARLELAVDALVLELDPSKRDAKLEAIVALRRILQEAWTLVGPINCLAIQGPRGPGR